MTERAERIKQKIRCSQTVADDLDKKTIIIQDDELIRRTEQKL